MSDEIDTLIPHRPPMRWINALTECTETTARATACFQPEDFAVTNGAPCETALVECIAQTVAAALGYRGRAQGKSGPAKEGMLVGVSNFKIHSRPAVGKILVIEIRELKRLGTMLMISGTISCDGQVIASGELSLYA